MDGSFWERSIFRARSKLIFSYSSHNKKRVKGESRWLI